MMASASRQVCPVFIYATPSGTRPFLPFSACSLSEVCLISSLLLYGPNQYDVDQFNRFMIRFGTQLFRFLLVLTIYLLCYDKNLVYAEQAVSKQSPNKYGTLDSLRLVESTFIQSPPSPSSSSFSSSKQPGSSDHGRMPFGFPGRATSNGGNDRLVYRYPQVPLDVENYPVAPNPLQLEQVHVFVRHGESLPPFQIPSVSY